MTEAELLRVEQLRADIARKTQEMLFEPRKYRLQFSAVIMSVFVAGGIIGGVLVGYLGTRQPQTIRASRSTAVSQMTPPPQENLMTIEELARNVAARMRAIDSHITTSAYRPLKPGEQDECPTGDDFNLLWDALLNEFSGAGIDLGRLVRPDIMTLDQFRATGRDCDDLGEALGDSRWDDGVGPACGRLYLEALYIERAMHSNGEWYLDLGQDGLITNDLPRLEARLYEWAVANDYCKA